MQYPNTREGRNQVIDRIAKLEARGYSREDKHNDSVLLSKIIRKGKVVKEMEIVKFIFKPSEATIIDDTTVVQLGLQEAKAMLPRWAAVAIEVGNAVKAGLMDENDKEILQKHYGVEKWRKKDGI